MAKKKQINYSETFIIPDIPTQPYPVYSVSENGKVYSIKEVLYPNATSKRKFTRKKQLSKRSMQAKIFDALINVGYFQHLTVYREFPVIIQNYLRFGVEGGFYLLDYYFPELMLCVELDSDYHDDAKDKARDKYLQRIGITTFRIKNLEKEDVQKTKFKELINIISIRSRNPLPIRPFDFLENIREKKNL